MEVLQMTKKDKDMNEANIVEESFQILNSLVLSCRVIKKYTLKECDAIVLEIKKTEQKKDSFLAQFPDGNEILLNYHQYKIFSEMMSELNEQTARFNYLITNCIISIATQFDNYLASLLKYLLVSRPDLIGVYDKELRLREVLEFSSQDKLREHCINLKIEELMYKSHREQIEWVDAKFGLNLAKNFNEWKEIILSFEVRNILVHNDGIINERFLQKLKEAKIPATKYKNGELFPLTPKFIDRMENILVSFACNLYYYLMSKLFPNVIDEIDNSLNSIIYNSLVQRDYNKAIRIVDSITSHKERHSNFVHFMLIINKAIALKFGGDNEQALKLLGSEDWSSCNNELLMAKAVLEDDFKTASTYMNKLNLSEMEYPYIEWPLFEKFRESKEFQDEYLKLYGISFADRLRNLSEERTKELGHIELQKAKTSLEQLEAELMELDSSLGEKLQTNKIAS